MPSIRPSALVSLDDNLALLCESLEKLELAKSVDIAEVIQHLKTAAESSQKVHALVVSELPDASWQNREELDALLEEEARALEQLRSRLLALASELERGRIVHRRAVRVNQLNRLRDQAIVELRSQAEVEGSPPTLPGPAADQWIEWASGLKEPEDAESIQTLRNGFPRLDELVANLELTMWIGKALPETSGENREELDTLLKQEASALEQLRFRLLALATELERGRIVHHRAFRVNRLNQLRDQAIKELRSKAGVEGTPPTLPGPPADQWIKWASGLKEPEDAESIQTLRNGFARLDEFVANLEPDMWIAEASQSSENLPEPGRSADTRHQEPSRLETNEFEEPLVPAGPLPIKLKAVKSSGVRDEPRVAHSLDAPSVSAHESDTLPLNRVTPPRTEEEEVQRVPVKEQEQPQSASITKLVIVRAPQFNDSDEASLSAALPAETSAARAVRTYTGIRAGELWARVAELWRSKRRMLLLVIAAVVLLLGALGAILWRLHRMQTSDSAVKAIATNIPDRTQRNQQNKDSYQSAVTTAADTSLTPLTKKESKPNDQKVAAKPTSTVQAEKAVNKLDNKLRTPEAIPKTSAAIRAEEASPGGSAGLPGMVVGVLPSGIAKSVANVGPDIPATKPKLAEHKLNVSSGVAQGLLIHQVTPKYPPLARQLGVQGTVVLHAEIGKDGSVEKVHVVSGHRMLTQAAMDAVKQWRYKPYYLDGEPVAAEIQINIDFKP